MSGGITRRAFVAGGLAALLEGCVVAVPRAYDDALRLFEQGAFRDAIPLLDQVIAEDPRPEVYTTRGSAYANLGQYDRAIADYGEAIKRDLNFALAFKCKGFAYGKKAVLRRTLGEDIVANALLEQAAQDLQFAVKLAPNDPQAHAYLGTIYYLQSEEQKARWELEDAVDLLGSPRKGMLEWELEARTLFDSLKGRYRSRKL